MRTVVVPPFVTEVLREAERVKTFYFEGDVEMSWDSQLGEHFVTTALYNVLSARGVVCES
jgi:hypothetical protein